jgi:hypothetical protein
MDRRHGGRVASTPFAVGKVDYVSSNVLCLAISLPSKRRLTPAVVTIS